MYWKPLVGTNKLLVSPFCFSIIAGVSKSVTWLARQLVVSCAAAAPVKFMLSAPTEHESSGRWFTGFSDDRSFAASATPQNGRPGTIAGHSGSTLTPSGHQRRRRRPGDGGYDSLEPSIAESRCSENFPMQRRSSGHLHRYQGGDPQSPPATKNLVTRLSSSR